jgi:non-specific serine/threonine protein kinase
MWNVIGNVMDLRSCLETEGALFVRKEDFWMIRFGGQTALLRDTRGLHDIACLLGAPGRDFHVSELIAGDSHAAPAPCAAVRPEAESAIFVNARHDRSSPILDARAKAEYRRRIIELQEELRDAEQCNDGGRAVQTREELSVIARELASAVGLGGRDRRASSEAERARSAVTKRVKQMIQKIGDAIPTLGRHLTVAIKTGYFCAYKPHPDELVAWKF